MKTIIVYHSGDLDGQCSGALMYFACKDSDVVLIPLENDKLDQDIKFEKVANHIESCKLKGQPVQVFFADICFHPYERMFKIDEETDMTIFDHHKTTIDALLDKTRNPIIYTPTNEISACKLVYEHLYKQEKYDETINMLSEYDCFHNSNKDWETKILPFQMGMRLDNSDINTDEGKKFWNNIFENPDENRMIETGKMILKYQSNQDALVAKNVMRVKFEGFHFACLNNNAPGSRVLASVWNDTIYDARMVFTVINKDVVKVSMYRGPEKGESFIDLSKIAVKWNGGGHASACGFQVTLEQMGNILNGIYGG